MGVAIVGGETDLVRSLAARIDARGSAAVAISADTAERIESQLQAAADSLGPMPAVVRIGIRPEQAVPAAVAVTGAGEWAARAERPLQDAVRFHQAAARFLADRGGRIIVILPTTGLSGAPGFTPLATAVEGERSLAKAQARISGANHVTINCIAVTPSLLAATTERDLQRGGLPPAAMPAPDLDRLADLITLMCDDRFGGVTGQTIALDGGRWMAP